MKSNRKYQFKDEWDNIVLCTNDQNVSPVRAPEGFLKNKGLLKTLSLSLSQSVGVKVLPTLLMIENCSEVLERFGEIHGWPLMVRMDFLKLPRRKTLGGIPVKSLLIANHINHFLYEMECYPLYHPHLDRFKDVYSCGILMSRDDTEMQIEIVGRGFDAADLRLGLTTPHEIIKTDSMRRGFERISLINESVYHRQRIERLQRMNRLGAYIDYANNYGRLLNDLFVLEDKYQRRNFNIGRRIPKQYIPIPNEEVADICEFGVKIQSDVLPNLPVSNKYVASFSYVPRYGWILWDIFGSWYNR